jgi:hypothetical protein
MLDKVYSLFLVFDFAVIPDSIRDPGDPRPSLDWIPALAGKST